MARTRPALTFHNQTLSVKQSAGDNRAPPTSAAADQSPTDRSVNTERDGSTSIHVRFTSSTCDGAGVIRSLVHFRVKKPPMPSTAYWQTPFPVTDCADIDRRYSRYKTHYLIYEDKRRKSMSKCQHVVKSLEGRRGECSLDCGIEKPQKKNTKENTRREA